MTMKEALRTRLLGAAGVPGATVSWFERPRGAGKWILLTPVSPGEEWTHDGPDGLGEPRVQIDCWATKSGDALALAAAVKAELQQLVAVTIGGWTFLPPASLELERFDTDDLAGGVKLFRVQQDFEFYVQAAG